MNASEARVLTEKGLDEQKAIALRQLPELLKTVERGIAIAAAAGDSYWHVVYRHIKDLHRDVLALLKSELEGRGFKCEYANAHPLVLLVKW